MERVVILGPGGAGKSTLARALGRQELIGVVELDEHFWKPGLEPTPADEWARIQNELTAPERWILDGDLGPWDVLGVRLRRADTVIILDFPLLICAARAARRGPRKAPFWYWLVTWRWKFRPGIMREVAACAGQAEVVRLRSPRAVRAFLRNRESRKHEPDESSRR